MPDPVDPDVYRQYLRHDSPAASPARVVRAVFQSDTSPPLYYLLLYGWTRSFGTSDWAVRMFSVVAALACFPLIWSIGRQLAGIRGALAACALYTLSPTAVYYATEGRMYSLLWLFTLCSMAMTLRMWRHGSDFTTLTLWVLSAAAGLMTHYFFIFVFAALCAGLMLMPRRASRMSRFWAAPPSVGLLIAPWFAQIPATMEHWRVTDYWLKLQPWNFSFLRSSLYLPWSYFSLRGDWGGRPRYDYINAAVFARGRALCRVQVDATTAGADPADARRLRRRGVRRADRVRPVAGHVRRQLPALRPRRLPRGDPARGRRHRPPAVSARATYRSPSILLVSSLGAHPDVPQQRPPPRHPAGGRHHQPESDRRRPGDRQLDPVRRHRHRPLHAKLDRRIRRPWRRGRAIQTAARSPTTSSAWPAAANASSSCASTKSRRTIRTKNGSGRMSTIRRGLNSRTCASASFSRSAPNGSDHFAQLARQPIISLVKIDSDTRSRRTRCGSSASLRSRRW